MQHLRGIFPSEVLSSDDICALHQGAVAEQFVGQELLAAGGTENHELYYWSRAEQRGNAEVDYLLARGGKIFPIEVKSVASGRLKSLHRFLAEHAATPYGLVFSGVAQQKRREDKLFFVPIYTQFPGLEAALPKEPKI